MQTFTIIYKENDAVDRFKATAKNRGIARAEFKQQHPQAKILTISMGVTPEQKAIQEAAAAGPLQVGVQKSLNLGFSDLPLFREDNQLNLF